MTHITAGTSESGSADQSPRQRRDLSDHGRPAEKPFGLRTGAEPRSAVGTRANLTKLTAAALTGVAWGPDYWGP